MISEQEINRVAKASEEFKPAILAARYLADSDRVELVTPWCVLIIERERIEEFRNLSPADLEMICF